MEKPIRIRILDHEYLLSSDEDEARVNEIAQFVDVKLGEIRDSGGKLSEGRWQYWPLFILRAIIFRY